MPENGKTKERRARFNALADELGMERGKPEITFDFSEVEEINR